MMEAMIQGHDFLSYSGGFKTAAEMQPCEVLSGSYSGLKLMPVHMSTAAPKSMILTSPPVVTRTLSGFTYVNTCEPQIEADGVWGLFIFLMTTSRSSSRSSPQITEGASSLLDE